MIMYGIQCSMISAHLYIMGWNGIPEPTMHWPEVLEEDS